MLFQLLISQQQLKSRFPEKISMAHNSSPTVIFIDDKQETLMPLARSVQEQGMAGCEVDSPEDINEEVLASADLVVVDYTLDDWIDKVDVRELSLKPVNGVALASVLREHAQKLKNAPPTGFALITGQPGNVSLTPGERRPHVVARLSNLEWFFEKQTVNVQQIVSLATAIHELPSDLSSDLASIDRLMDLLGVGDSPLRERYRDAVERCRPPIHHLSKDSGGIVLLRWLLHRILPHTCFLFDVYTMAARLRISPSSLKSELMLETDFTEKLQEYVYKGPLAEFDGKRWWRGGIEQWLWEVTDGNSATPDAIWEALGELGVSKVEMLKLVRPVVTLDDKFRREEQLSDRKNVDALHLDDWPSYAEPAYARKDLLDKHNDLKIFRVSESR